MKKLTFIVLTLFLLIGCSKTNQDFISWNKVKNEKDFSLFFNFAINTFDTSLVPVCIDSLEKYKPQKQCITLNMLNYYVSDNDTIIYTGFLEEDECNVHLESKVRNIVYTNINRYDSISIKYVNEKYENLNDLLVTLFDTVGTSYEIPEHRIVIADSKEYYKRNLAVIVHCEMFPDTLLHKTSWKSLIETTKDILYTYENVKNQKSRKIYSKDYSELNDKEKKFIINLIPFYIKIRFYYSIFAIQVPPPPPPMSKEVLEILNDTIESDLGL